MNQFFKLGCEVEARLSATVTLFIKQVIKQVIKWGSVTSWSQLSMDPSHQYAPALFEKDAVSHEESRKMRADP